jgi:hypothetical protein
MLDTAAVSTVPRLHVVASMARQQLVAADFVAAVDPVVEVGSTAAVAPTAVVTANR